MANKLFISHHQNTDALGIVTSSSPSFSCVRDEIKECIWEAYNQLQHRRSWAVSKLSAISKYDAILFILA